jgi:hypothetical protein
MSDAGERQFPSSMTQFVASEATEVSSNFHDGILQYDEAIKDYKAFPLLGNVFQFFAD